MPCPKIERCPLYPELKLELSLRIWQSKFCNTEGEYKGCARYKLSKSGEMPDPRLMPNGDLLGNLKK